MRQVLANGLQCNVPFHASSPLRTTRKHSNQFDNLLLHVDERYNKRRNVYGSEIYSEKTKCEKLKN